jgi:hypothetical protein
MAAPRPCLICGQNVMALATRPDAEARDHRPGYVLVAFIHASGAEPCVARLSVPDVSAFVALAALTGDDPPAHVH